MKFLFLLLSALSLAAPLSLRAQDGALDAAYDPQPDGAVQSITPLADGKTLISGSFRNVGGLARASLARLNDDGTADASFAPAPGSVGRGPVAVQDDGKILAVTSGGKVVRLNDDGSLDASFDSTVGIASGDDIRALVVLPGGKILVGGAFNQFGALFTDGVARLNADGSLDASFVSKAGFFLADAIALLPDGTLYVAGGDGSGNATQPTELARLGADGGLIASFDATPGAGQGAAEIDHLALQEDGKLIVSGRFATIQGVARPGVARLNADGSVDASFDPGSGPANFNTILASALQADGKVVVAGGFTSFNGTAINRVARLNDDGSVDTLFDPGTGPDRPGGEFNGVTTLALDGFANVLIGGDFTEVSGAARNGLARLSVFSVIYQTLGPQADLSAKVRDLSIKPNGKKSKTIIKGTVTFKNAGAKTAKDVKLAAYLSANASLDASDTLLATFTSTDLGYPKIKKQTRIGPIPFRFPAPAALAGLASGKYLILVIDPRNEIPDGDRSNNRIVIGPLP